jgi:hypothetical protein
MLQFKFTIAGEKQVNIEMRNLRVEDFTPLWDLYREELFLIERKMFTSHGAIGTHRGWQALDSDYLERKERKWPINEIELASGREPRASRSFRARGQDSP